MDDLRLVLLLYGQKILLASSGKDDAWTVVQLINKEWEAHGLDALSVDDGLMELAAVRAVELGICTLIPNQM